MEEAIFQGTERRKPIHRAEVVLSISNEDHLLPVPYSDVRISRTLYRGGESEYRLNGTLCRLRDIQDLCRDTGIGSNAYAIIEGRMIDTILGDRAEERRSMFEEAAGIGRYKERRRVASHRLDEADADLARVDDVVSEVQTKVRSLARQRGRAQRYLQMRERKLALELALALAEVTTLQASENDIASELQNLGDALVSDSAKQRSVEAELEAVQLQLVDSERARASNVRKLMAVRDQLAERERARLLAEERGRHAKARRERVSAEQGELETRKLSLAGEVERLIEVSRERSSALRSIREALAREEIALAEIAERRGAMEAGAAVAESEQQAYREQRVKMQARQDSARAEAAELERLIGQAEQRLVAIAATLEGAAQEGDKARAAAATAEDKRRQVTRDLAAERAQLAQIQTERDEVRAAWAALMERLRATEARIETLDSLIAGDEGMSLAAQAAMARAEELGIRGILGHGIEVAEEFAEGLESYLGPYLEGLVVDDAAAAERIRRWFLEKYDGPGGLVVLPLDRISSQPDSRAPLPGRIQATGPGEEWLRYLLRDVELAEDSGGSSAEAWIGLRVSVDTMGVCRLGRPYAGAGLLARRAELKRLETQRSELGSEAEALAVDLERAEERVTSQGAKVEGLEAARRAAEEDSARLAARAEATAERLARVKEEDEAIRATVAQLRGQAERARERAEAEAAALEALESDGPAEVPKAEELTAVRASWEQLRERVADLRLEEAKAAAALDRAEHDLRAQQDAVKSVGDLGARLAQETEELESVLVKVEEESETATADLEIFVAKRTTWEHEGQELEQAAEGLRQKVTELEGLLRQARVRERDQAERRHEFELKRTQVVAGLERTRERLEDEWGQTFDELAREVEAASGEASELEAELAEIVEQLSRMGPVNMLAEQEYQEQRERVEFLQSQRADLVKARDDLRETISRINDTASKVLLETIEQIRINFHRTFSTLFEGGHCDVWLEEPDWPLDSAIEISASPAGKKTRRIHMLSGGERALTALALLFALYLVKPSPFCVMDEVDAPLDETNVRRFVAMLERFKSDVQFIVITHNPVTIEAADWIYGVTMEEPGVSKIVGVEFAEFARDAVA